MASIVDPPSDSKTDTRPCPECEGSGCPDCDGTGRAYCYVMGELCSGVCPYCRADLR